MMTRRDDEQGVVVIMMAFICMALVIMAALVIDVGALLDERRQLQNGADAASLAVARTCALGSCDAATASTYANANASDLAASVDSVTYPATNHVRVAASTRTSGGKKILPYSFGRAATGQEGGTVHADSTAAWGAVGKASAIRLAISHCDVRRLGFNRTDVILFQGNSSCDSSSGSDRPGAFGWLDNTRGVCEMDFTANQVVSADPGTSGPGCLAPLVGQELMVPVFSTVSGSGTNAKYTIVGFARFFLTGYNFKGQNASSGDTSSCDTGNSKDTCLVGRFVRYVTTAEAIGGADFGVYKLFLVS